MFDRRRLFAALLALLFLAGSGACHRGGKPGVPDPGSAEADKFLFDRGTLYLTKKNWLMAREYFKRIIDTYPQSPYRHDARLGIGDAYLGENRTDTIILGVNEFRQFLQFAPLHPRAPYAQYKICLGQSKQMLSSQRDQTATREALIDCDAFLKNPAYANSEYKPEVEKIRRRVRDRLSESEFNVGMVYFRGKWWQGAHDRFYPLLSDDPDYTHIDRVLFYEAETNYRSGRIAEALPLYDKLIKTYPKTEFVKKAQERMTAGTAALKAPPPIKK